MTFIVRGKPVHYYKKKAAQGKTYDSQGKHTEKGGLFLFITA